MKAWILIGLALWLFLSQGRAQNDWVTFAEEEAKFTKGDLFDFLSRQIEYPEDARERKIQGKVFVSFVVDTTGKLAEIKLLKSLGYGCDEEAVNAVSATSGFWLPAKNKGKKVRLKMVLPVVFSLSPIKAK